MRGKKESAEKKLEKFFSEAVVESDVQNVEPIVVKEDFEVQSPLLKEQVIERISEISLDAVDEPVIQEIKEGQGFTTFGMPNFSVAPEKESIEIIAEEPVVKPVEAGRDELPKMSLEDKVEGAETVSLQGIQKKAGQTTAKWSWTLFENAGPKIQMFFSEINESEIRKLVIDDHLPKDSIDFTKDYNKSLEEELEIKDWEKELIYPPFEELLEQAGMNASMSPAARLGVGISVVLGARAMQIKKYREEREELLEKLISSYAKTKNEIQPITPTS